MLTPITIRQWYIGDGGLVHNGTKSPYVMLYSYGFVIKDMMWLIKQLIKIGFKVTRQPYLNRIHISSYSTRDFLKYIGNCPVNCYKYKWAY